jgi:hypothetical protein
MLRWARRAAALAAIAGGACGTPFVAADGASTGAGGATTTTTPTTSASGGSPAGGSTHAGGAGGIGGAPECDGHATQTCYDGPDGTAGLGICRAGFQTCSNGVWGPCYGAVVPQDDEACPPTSDTFCDGTPCGHVTLVANLGGAGDDTILSVAADPSGPIYVVGRTDGAVLGNTPIDGGSGASSIFAARLDASGAVVWARRLGGGKPWSPQQLRPEARVALGPTGRVFVAGSFHGDLDLGGATKPATSPNGAPIAFVGELDAASGEGAWVRPIVADTESYAPVLVATGAGLFVAGTACCSTLVTAAHTLSISSYDGFIATFHEGGAFLGAYALGGPQVFPIAGVALGPAEGVALVGRHVGAWGYVGDVTPSPSSDAFVLGFDGQTKTFGAYVSGAGAKELRGVARSADGSLALVGWAEGAVTFGNASEPIGGHDALFAKLGQDHVAANAFLHGDAASQEARGVVVDQHDRAYAVIANAGGAFNVAGVQVNGAGIVTAFQPDRTIRWWASFTGDPTAVATDGRRLIVVGSFAGTLSADGKSAPSNGATDGFVLAYAP